jgi:hypothetical protein
MTIRATLTLATIIGLLASSALAQTVEAPKARGTPLKPVKPLAPMGCKLLGAVKGTKIWAGDCAPSELRASPAAQPAAPALAPEPNPPSGKH